jgi:hypothetical protein
LFSQAVLERFAEKVMNARLVITGIVLSLGLAACGTNTTERVGSGALIGGAAGAVMGGSVGSTAAGAAVGAGGGYLVDRSKR